MSNDMMPEVPEEVKNKIDAISVDFRLAMSQGKYDVAEVLLLKIWEILPEPKYGWNFYSQVMPRELVVFYRDIGKYEDALKWLKITHIAYGSDNNSYVRFLEATVYHGQGDFSRAFHIFDELYKLYKARIIVGHNEKYKHFYMEKKKRR